MDVLYSYEYDFKLVCPKQQNLDEVSVFTKYLADTKYRKACKWLKALENSANLRRQCASQQMKSKLYVTLHKKGSDLIEHLVYQADDRLQLKLYLLYLGQRLHDGTDCKNAMRMLEAALAIDVANTDTTQIFCFTSEVLSNVYKDMGHYSKCLKLCDLFAAKMNSMVKEAQFSGTTGAFTPSSSWQGEEEHSVVGWERDLFGNADSRNVSCKKLKGSLIAKRSFDVGEVIFIQKPVVGYVADSKGQCNHCTWKLLHTIPCPVCCAVFYCSESCRLKDDNLHKYECRAFKLLFFPLVHGVLELRMLVKALEKLKHNLTSHGQRAIPLTTVKQLWEVLSTQCQHTSDLLDIILSYDQNDFDDESYKNLLSKSAAILEYVLFDGQLLNDYGLCFGQICSKARHIFLGSLLLRIAMVTSKIGCTFMYDLAYDSKDIDERIVSRCPDDDVAQMLIEIKSHQTNEKKTDVLPKDIMVELFSSNDTAAYPKTRQNVANLWRLCFDLATAEVGIDADTVIESTFKLFCENYYSTFNLLQRLNKSRTVANQYHGVYRFPLEIEHCCITPNTIAILLNHGAVAFRATKRIERGEQLKLLHSANAGLDLISTRYYKTQTDALKERLIQFAESDCKVSPRQIYITIATYFSCTRKLKRPHTYSTYKEILVAMACCLSIFQKWSKEPSSIPMLINAIVEVERVCREGMLISELLMHHEWMFQLMTYRQKLRYLKTRNNKRLIYHNFKKIFSKC